MHSNNRETLKKSNAAKARYLSVLFSWILSCEERSPFQNGILFFIAMIARHRPEIKAKIICKYSVMLHPTMPHAVITFLKTRGM